MDSTRSVSDRGAEDRTFGVVRLLVCAILTSLNAWMTQGVFLPLGLDERGVDYVIVSAGLAAFLWDLLVAGAILLLWHTVAVWMKLPPGERRFLTRENTRYLNPLLLLAFSLVPLVNLAGPPGAAIAPWSYVLFDLRWWWWSLLVLAVVRATGPGLGRVGIPRFTGWSSRTQQLSLAGAVVLAALVSTPGLRFSPSLNGDEPKYLRYCETLYQGVGFDISKLQLISRLPENFRPRVAANLTGALTAVPEEWANLRRDAVALWRGQREFNKARYLGGWFVAGKRPGTEYQVHTPGLAMVLLPAYYLDRRVLSPGWRWDGKFPQRLDVTQAALMTLFALLGVILFRILRDHLEDTRLAWILALFAMTTLPVGAFTFQVYPEIAAGVLLLAAVRFLLNLPRQGARAGILHGLGAGFLIWLHVRFGLAVFALLVWSLFGWRRYRAASLAFASGLLAAMGAFSLYAYRLTGSLLPTAMYDTRGDYFSALAAANGLAALAFDNSWGLFAHTPIYVLALMGAGITARRRPAAFGLTAVVVFSLAVSAGHDPTAASTTPMRYLVAGVPLLMLLVGDAAARWRDSRVFVAAVVVLGLVSLDTGVAYNLHHYRGFDSLLVDGFSGWRPNQLFPELTRSGRMAMPPYIGLTFVWGLVAAALVTLGVVAGRAGAGRNAGAGTARCNRFAPVDTRLVVLGIALLAVAGTVVGALTGDWHRQDYLSTAPESRVRALSFYLERGGRCALCATSRLGGVNPGEALGHEATQLTLQAPAMIEPGQPFEAVVGALGPDKEAGWGSLRVDFGDGTVTPAGRFLGELRIAHAYQRRGTYRLKAWFQTDRTVLATSESVEVAPYPPDKDRPWPPETWVGAHRIAAASLLALAVLCAVQFRTIFRQRQQLRQTRPGVGPLSR